MYTAQSQIEYSGVQKSETTYGYYTCNIQHTVCGSFEGQASAGPVHSRVCVVNVATKWRAACIIDADVSAH